MPTMERVRRYLGRRIDTTAPFMITTMEEAHALRDLAQRLSLMGDEEAVAAMLDWLESYEQS